MADTESAETAERQLVAFTLAGETYGVDVLKVREIIRMQKITRVPNAPELVEGVINLRGRICPVVDLRKRLDVEVSEATDESRIVIVDIDGEEVGAIVDAVTEVFRISGDSVEPASQVMATAESSVVEGIANLRDRHVILIDLHAALKGDSSGALPQVETAAA